jgi:hypothetical protein
MVSIPAALLAGIGCTEVFRPLLTDLWVNGGLRRAERAVIATGAAVVLSLYVLLNPVFLIRSAVEGETLSRHAIDAMDWARENTPTESKFIALSGEQVREWFPQIARRTGLNGHWGSEWEPAEWTEMWRLNKLLDACHDLDCIQLRVAETLGYREMYLDVDKARYSELEQGAQERDSGFELLWENSEVAIGRFSDGEDL